MKCITRKAVRFPSKSKLHLSPRPPRRPTVAQSSISHSRRAAFTLLEVMVALAVIVATIATTYSALLILNRRAAATRAMNAAKSICEQYINRAQKVGYNPLFRKSSQGVVELAKPDSIPLILRVTTGSTVTPRDFPEGYAPPPDSEPFDVDEDPTNGSNSRVTLQSNAYTAAETMPAWVFRKVDPIGSEGTLSVRFIVCFTERGDMYSVQLDTMRAPDSIR